MIKTIHYCARVLGLTALVALHPWPARAQHPPISPARTTTAPPNEFGTSDYTVTVIPASAFTSDKFPTTDFGNLYRRFEPYDSAGHFFSGVDIPAGAVIDFVGLRLHNDTYYPYVNYQLNLFSVDQHSGTTSGVVSFLEDYQTAFYTTTYNETPLGFAWTQNAHQALVVDVYQIPYDCPILTFCRHDFGMGWVEIWWKRTVSPPPATPSFTDVPTDDGAYQYVEALKASGITVGCGASTFCPDATLTRRQMAVFLSKALGLHWPN